MAKSKREKLSVALFKGAENDIKNNITIDPELDNLIPPLSEDELEQLEVSLKQEGCREPLIVWQSGDSFILIDGHNRYRLCQKNNIKFDIRLKNFNNKGEVKDWMIGNQMARRNLTPLQMSYLRGIRYENEKHTWGGNRGRKEANGQDVHLPTPTAAKLSEEYGVNEKTIRRDGQFALALEKLTGNDQDLRWNILNGNIKAGKKTITSLVDSEPKYLTQIQKKIRDTESLEKTITLLQSESLEDEETNENEQVKVLKKSLAFLTNKALKMSKSDPRRKEVIKELRQNFKEFLKALES
ncbi:ParB N-terminal domain-containing protein [Catalinimonas sp. 4WD22]|uniref:ParB N-terminal domain-containing protein n=1 Tax=Catalinimonas locisalis TaxID=3133978 RepID=UPI003101A3C6